MSIYDPFDPARLRDGPNCICGRHRSQTEHDHEARLALQCAVETEREDRRFAGVVAAAALRSAFRRPSRG